jgi:hypothetical protein
MPKKHGKLDAQNCNPMDDCGQQGRGSNDVKTKRLLSTKLSDEDLNRYTAKLQPTLDRVSEFVETNVSKPGTSEFPYHGRETEAKR